MRYQGRITRWDDDRGFGQITWHGDGPPVFVHIKAFTRGLRRPMLNDVVTYELGKDERGRPRAEKVQFSRRAGPPSNVAHRKPGRLPVVFTLIFLIVVTSLVVIGRLSPLVLAIYAGASVVAFVAYGFDKAAAESRSWRTPESTLHLLALLGGWPGALAAQRVLRHKSVKAAFQSVFWVTVGINIAILMIVSFNDGLHEQLPF